MSNISKIQLPDGGIHNIDDETKLPLAGGTVTGPVSFGDSVSIDEATIGDLVVNGNGSFTNNIQANTINGVTVGTTPKFTDTVTTATTSGSGNAVTAITASNGALTVTKGSTFLTASDISGKIDTAGTGLSKSGTTLNHSNSVTAQTTQALYPIKIDAQGHISAYGTAVTSLPASDVYSWAKASSKPSYNFSEIGNTPTTLSGYGITDAKIASGVITLGSNTITPLTSSSTLNAANLSGAIPSSVTATTQSAGDNSTKIATTKFVQDAMSAAGAGTVTSVGVSNATNGGLSISGSPVTSSGIITVGHSNVLTNAQTTQAVYPIKIDKNGHISAYGSAVTIVNTRGTPTSGGTTLSVVNTGDMYTWNNKTDYGAQIIRWSE